MTPNLVDLIKAWLFESCLFIHWTAVHEDTKINYFNGIIDDNIGYLTQNCSDSNTYVMIYDDKIIAHDLLGERPEVFQASDPEFFDRLGSKLRFIHNDRRKNCTMLL